MIYLFRDRWDAGQRLAQELSLFQAEHPIVVGIPHGGMAVALEISRALGCELDAAFIQKLRAPLGPTAEIGALSEDFSPVWSYEKVNELDVDPDYFAQIAAHQAAELRKIIAKYRTGRPPSRLQGRTVLLVDDGSSLDVSVLAAAGFLKKQNPRKIVFASPVCDLATCRRLESEVSTIVCLQSLEATDRTSIAAWYESFDAITDDELGKILDEAAKARKITRYEARIPIRNQGVRLEADWVIPASPSGNHPADHPADYLAHHLGGTVIFAHGLGSSRHDHRDMFIAQKLNQAGFATLLFDFLTSEEALDRKAIQDVPFMAKRLISVTRWLEDHAKETRNLKLGYFGSSEGASPVLWTAAELGELASAVVLRGGRTDGAEDHLHLITAPTLLIAGARDSEIVAMNQKALRLLRAPKTLMVIPDAGHLFEEHGALDTVAHYAAQWFSKCFAVTPLRRRKSA